MIQKECPYCRKYSEAVAHGETCPNCQPYHQKTTYNPMKVIVVICFIGLIVALVRAVM